MTQAALDLPEVEIDEAALIDNLAAMQDLSDEGKWPSRLLELADVFEATFHRARVTLADLTPRQAAELMVRALASNQGGRPVYLPTGEAIEDALRARRVWRDSGHMSIEELATREGVVVQTIYRDLGRIKSVEKKRRQPKLL